MSFNKEKKGSYGRNLLLMLLLTAITFAVILSGNDMENLIQALKTSRFMWLLAGFLSNDFIYCFGLPVGHADVRRNNGPAPSGPCCADSGPFKISFTLWTDYERRRCRIDGFISYFRKNCSKSSFIAPSDGRPAPSGKAPPGKQRTLVKRNPALSAERLCYPSETAAFYPGINGFPASNGRPVLGSLLCLPGFRILGPSPRGIDDLSVHSDFVRIGHADSRRRGSCGGRLPLCL